jgi:hypothetical protein
MLLAPIFEILQRLLTRFIGKFKSKRIDIVKKSAVEEGKNFPTTKANKKRRIEKLIYKKEISKTYVAWVLIYCMHFTYTHHSNA